MNFIILAQKSKFCLGFLNEQARSSIFDQFSTLLAIFYLTTDIICLGG